MIFTNQTLNKYARATKDGVHKDLERVDTLYWCGLVTAQSGMSDAQVDEKLG